jgi:uncharacterized membrane protein YeaQ/YmgE (transglycosylase-associated protein family)
MAGLIWWIIVGFIAGWASGTLLSDTGYGVIMDITLGIVGAMIGRYVMHTLTTGRPGGLLPSMLFAIVGACLLVALVRFVVGSRVAY